MLRMLSSPRAADLQLLAARKTPLKEKQRVLPEGLQEGNLWVLAQIVVQGTGATAVDARDLSSTRCSAQVCYIAEAPSTKSSGSSCQRTSSRVLSTASDGAPSLIVVVFKPSKCPTN